MNAYWAETWSLQGYHPPHIEAQELRQDSASLVYRQNFLDLQPSWWSKSWKGILVEKIEVGPLHVSPKERTWIFVKKKIIYTGSKCMCTMRNTGRL